jgi:hypothetical protein
MDNMCIYFVLVHVYSSRQIGLPDVYEVSVRVVHIYQETNLPPKYFKRKAPENTPLKATSYSTLTTFTH